MGMIVIGAGLDCRLSAREGKPLVEFTFEGDDDGHPVYVGDDRERREVPGWLFLHLADAR